MSLFQWPFKRKQYAGLGNPRFVGDIVAANEAVLDGLTALAGLGPNDFAIISGMVYTSGSPGSYSVGIFYLSGSFYYMPASFNEGFYLTQNNVDTQPQPFSDAVVRDIYTLQQGTTSSAAVTNCPQFAGNMNAYRLSLQSLNSAIGILNGLFATLGNAAFRNIGTVTGTVAAGDDARFGYTIAQINSLFALQSQVLLLTSPAGFTFTPTADYQPATKRYVDQSASMKLRWCGLISADASILTKQAGDLTITAQHIGTGIYIINHNMGSLNYWVQGKGYSSAFDVFASPRVIVNQSRNAFQVGVYDDSSPNDYPFQLQIIQYFP
jgi:hypothetical protein